MNPKSDVVIFTDGSSRGNPGPGGYAAIVVKCDDSRIHADRTQINADDSGMHVVELGGREEHTTNNRMELQAAISALSFLSSLRIKDKGLRIVIYSDSSYLVNGITRWIHGWQKNGWKTKEKKDVENRDLWETLVAAVRGKIVKWNQVGGHVGVAGNVRCDEIATAFADNLPPKLYSGVLDLPAAPSGSAAQAGNYPIKNILDVSRGLPRTDLSADPRSVLGRQKKRSRSRATAYSYVSMVDGHVETHKTWAECEARVKGKPAKYKKVFSADEEAALIKELGEK